MGRSLPSRTAIGPGNDLGVGHDATNAICSHPRRGVAAIRSGRDALERCICVAAKLGLPASGAAQC